MYLGCLNLYFGFRTYILTVWTYILSVWTYILGFELIFGVSDLILRVSGSGRVGSGGSGGRPGRVSATFGEKPILGSPPTLVYQGTGRARLLRITSYPQHYFITIYTLHIIITFIFLLLVSIPCVIVTVCRRNRRSAQMYPHYPLTPLPSCPLIPLLSCPLLP